MNRTQRRQQAKTRITCTRCNLATTTPAKAKNWNVVFSAGVITGYLCPGCQTAEEEAEAKINEATIDYANEYTTVNPSDPNYFEVLALNMVNRCQFELDRWQAANTPFNAELLADYVIDYFAPVMTPTDRAAQRATLAQTITDMYLNPNGGDN